ncbi:MAG: hypothetical protein ACRCSV_04680 [Chlamydiales bacterium]
MSIKNDLASNSSNIHNSLSINSQKVFYKKILSNIMIGNEPRALQLINQLMVNKLGVVSHEKELEYLRPWPSTLLESAQSMRMTEIVKILKEMK